MSVTVQVFNASTLAMSVTVNNGTRVQIPGTGPSLNWAAQQTPNTPWGYTPGNPQPDLFGAGPNQVLLSVQGVITGQNLTIPMPSGFPIFSLQLYIFFSISQTISWALLDSGVIIAGNILMADAAMASAPEAPSSGEGGGDGGEAV